ncbi:MAG: ABC transporter substrate-binding protein, partial [Beijerinckiaceae bacterium]|nr:ABC transporter substrate-binding protein [Beijerinckiaceae bacterium]
MVLQGILALAAAVLTLFALPAAAAEAIEVKSAFIRLPRTQEALSILDIPAADDGIAGARLATEDNNTTGRFLVQTFTIEDVPIKSGDELAGVLDSLIRRGVYLFVTDLPAPPLLALSDAARDKGVLIFNAAAAEDSLREENCRGNVFHVAPSHSMLADGLAQYLVWKQWKRWLLMKG